MKKRNAGENIIVRNSSWTFGGDVAKKFDSHIKKSIPFYKESHNLICRISDYFLKDNSVFYEIGVSTGELFRKVAKRHSNKKIEFIGIDSEERMIKKAKTKIKKSKFIKLKSADITKIKKLKKSNLIVSHYCIQFIPIFERQKLIKKIYNSLNNNGCFIMFEKIRSHNPRFQDISTNIYTDFKLEQGYTPEEIIVKNNSLKGVLEPSTSKKNIEYLKEAGFKQIEIIFTYVPFQGIMAIK